MKKIIIMLAVVVSSLTAFARKENVSETVLNAFDKEFAGVKDVQWSTIGGNYQAAFVFNNQYVTAFYQADGELLKLTRNISLPDIPLCLQTSLKNNYSQYWISDLFEISNTKKTSYYITLENADSKIVLKSRSSGKWKVVKTSIKI